MILSKILAIAVPLSITATIVLPPTIISLNDNTSTHSEVVPEVNYEVKGGNVSFKCDETYSGQDDSQ